MKKVVFSIIFIIIGLIVAFGFYFSSHYFPNSELILYNKDFCYIDISLKTNEEVYLLISESLDNCTYTVVESDGTENQLNFNDIFNKVEKEGIIEKLDESKRLFNKSVISLGLEDFAELDRNKVKSFIDGINLKNSSNLIETEDAYISFNIETNKYEIIPEKYSNILLEDSVDIFINSFNCDEKIVDLKEIGCYAVPTILRDNNVLLNNLNKYKKYEDFKLIYNFGGNKEIIDIPVLNNWLIPNYKEDGSLNDETPFSFDINKISDYVNECNKKYTTFGSSRTFKTSKDTVVTLSKGDYGWWVNIPKMKEDILSHLNANKSEEKEAIYRQKAICYGEKDFKDSYVEISIDNQHLWMYKNGELVVDSPIVSGCVSTGNITPTGVYSLTYKTKNAVLRGPGYASPVSYWMPFNGDIGMHDATWRSAFGKTIYKYDGSHGCINMPLGAAKTVYNNLESDMPIIVW